MILENFYKFLIKVFYSTKEKKLKVSFLSPTL